METQYKIRFWFEKTHLKFYYESHDYFLGLLWFDMSQNFGSEEVAREMTHQHVDEIVIEKMPSEEFIIKGNIPRELIECKAEALFKLMCIIKAQIKEKTPIINDEMENRYWNWDLKYEIEEIEPDVYYTCNRCDKVFEFKEEQSLIEDKHSGLYICPNCAEQSDDEYENVCEGCYNTAVLSYYPDKDKYLCQTCIDWEYIQENVLQEDIPSRCENCTAYDLTCDGTECFKDRETIVPDGIIFGGH